MRNIKDCYVEIKRYNNFLYTKGSFYCSKAEVTVDLKERELGFEREDGEISIKSSSGQNYRRIKPDKDVNQQS